MKQTKRVEIQLYASDRGMGLTISRMNGDEGEGYRIAGPKMCGEEETVKSWTISRSEVDRLMSELELAKAFLQWPT